VPPIQYSQHPWNSYLLPIDVRHSLAALADTSVWVMHNASSSRRYFLLRFFLVITFDGIGVNLNTVRYKIQRYSGATPGGGVTVVPVPGSANAPGSEVAAQQAPGGVALNGAVFTTEMKVFGLPVSLTGVSQVYDMVFVHPPELRPGEGVAIRLTTAAIAGQGLSGFVEWEEFNQ